MSFWSLPGRGAPNIADVTLLYRSANKAITSATWTPIDWDEESRDVLGAHDNATNPERITIPAGVRFVRLTAYVNYNNTGTARRLVIERNGTDGVAADLRTPINEGSQGCQSPWLVGTAGDYYLVTVNVTGAGHTLIGPAAFGGRAFFQAEYIR